MGVLREQLTLFMGDSPADSLSPWLESKKGGTTKDIYGLSFRGWSPKLSRVGSLLKMYLASSNLPLTTFARVWSVLDTPLGYGILKLRLSERRTDGPEYSLWPTATAHGNNNRTGISAKSGNGLATAVKMFPTPDASVMNLDEPVDSVLRRREKYKAKWGNNGFGLRLATAVKIYPTPRASDAEHGGPNQRDSAGNPGLSAIVAMLPTPTVNDSKNSNPPSQHTENGRHTNPLNVVAGGSLNPAWVEWLMGFPIGWTDIGV